MSRTLAVVSALLNLGLGFLVFTISQHSTSSSAGISLGNDAKSIAAENSLGEPLSVRFPARLPLILYFFSPDCGWCERNFESASALARRTEGRFRFIALSVDDEGLSSWMNLRRPRFEVLHNLTFRSAAAYPVRLTPTMLVVSSSGKIERVWTGAFRGRV